MFMENLPKKGPLFGEFRPKNPPIWAAHTHYPQHVMLPPPPGERERSVPFRSVPKRERFLKGNGIERHDLVLV